MPLGDDFDGKADICMDGGLVLNEMELGVPLELAAEIVRRYNAHEELVGLLKELTSFGAFIGDRLPIKVAQPIFKKLQATLSDL